MGVREKLVELLDNFHRDLSPFAGNEKLFVVDDNVEQAEYLIEHGVTVQEWISVKDRLPSDEQDVLVIAHGWGGRLVYVGSHKRVEAQKSCLTGITNKSSEWLLWGWSYLKEPIVTHWMPMPQPPKEVERC